MEKAVFWEKTGELCGRQGKTAFRFVVEAVYGIISFSVGDAH